MNFWTRIISILLLISSVTASASEEYCKKVRAKFTPDSASSNQTYNMACCSALDNRADEAFSFLELAVKKGYIDYKWMVQNPDLKSLHQDKRWNLTIDRVIAAEEAYLSRVNVEVYKLYQEDQLDRQGANLDWKSIAKNDEDRRERALKHIDSDSLHHSDDYFHVAMLFQHGGTSENYKLAYELSMKSVELDPTNRKARWLACATEDRYLQSVGKPQIWGTQYSRKDATSAWTLEPFDRSAKTDEERKQWGVRTISESQARLDKMHKD